MSKNQQAAPVASRARTSPEGTESVPPDLMQEVFLPVHGNVELFVEELAIVDHPAFQRLRRVRQLGMAHMVFPGATHNRFEHSVGAVHVAQLIVDHVNANFEKPKDQFQEWEMAGIDDPTARFIRLAALLHDVGHLPFGHTLEDELNHLRPHDGPQRLVRVAQFAYPNHVVDQAVIPADKKPANGWTLMALIDRLYASHAKALGVTGDAFTILSHIVCKPPRQDGEKESWEEEARHLGGRLMLGVCKDNSIERYGWPSTSPRS